MTYADVDDGCTITRTATYRSPSALLMHSHSTAMAQPLAGHFASLRIIIIACCHLVDWAPAARETYASPEPLRTYGWLLRMLAPSNLCSPSWWPCPAQPLQHQCQWQWQYQCQCKCQTPFQRQRQCQSQCQRQCQSQRQRQRSCGYRPQESAGTVAAAVAT